MAYNYLPGDGTSQTIYTVRPYASHSSNIVNRLTRIYTYGYSGVTGDKDSFNVTKEVGNVTEVEIQPGKCVIDDVLIELEVPVTVELLDTNNFINNQTILTETGYYYLCIYYNYVLSRTLPRAIIQIYHPSLQGTYDWQGKYLLIKVLKVENIAGNNRVTEVLDYNPDNVDDYRRYRKSYIEFVGALPTFESTDLGRWIVLYDLEAETFQLYVGGINTWNLIETVGDPSGFARVHIAAVDPTSGDVSYDLGTFWINSVSNAAFILVDITGGVATWTELNAALSYASVVSDTSDPTPADDSQTVGTLWINTSTDVSFICVHQASGASVWTEIGSGSGTEIDIDSELKKRFLL